MAGGELGGGPVSPGVKAQVDILLKRERMMHERVKREILEGQYVRRELLDGALGGLAALFGEALDELEVTGPDRFAGKSAGAIEVELAKVIDSIKRRIVERAEYETRHVVDVAKDEAERRYSGGGRGPGRRGVGR